MRRISRGLLALALLFSATADARAQRTEALWYMTSSEASVQDFLAHADDISVVAPQTYSMDGDGIVWGGVDARVLAAAKAHGVAVVPLVVNPGFDQAAIHRVLTVPDVRSRAVHNLAALCRDNHFAGIQFDFENVNVTDRDAFSAFFRESADSLHAAGCTLSAAVVPRSSDFPGPTSYHRWIYENWRGAYDYKALADAGDFLSLMTYDQHSPHTPPGPVAGMPWMVKALEFVLAQGVPPEKVSLGIPAYSEHWFPVYDEAHGARVGGRETSYAAVMGELAKNGVQPTWDDRQKAAFASWENDGVNEFAYLENARSFRDKAALVAKYHLRGYSVWVLGMEDPEVWGVVTAVKR